MGNSKFTAEYQEKGMSCIAADRHSALRINWPCDTPRIQANRSRKAPLQSGKWDRIFPWNKNATLARHT